MSKFKDITATDKLQFYILLSGSQSLSNTFKHNFTMNWSRAQQHTGMLNRDGDQGHASCKN